ncbi:hypothetical protein DB347_23100 [Opitutaceae bacterium EW11]|nr:hypothetical protein DB347_23100 [Opitutaceae bacterium EW11]
MNTSVPTGSTGRREAPFHLGSALGVAALGLILPFAGCAGKKDQAPQAPIPAIVKRAEPAGAAVSEWSGSVRTRQGSTLAFSVPGRVQRILADVGDPVAAGTVLVELDQEPFELQLRQAEAEARAAVPALAEAKRRREAEQRLWSAGSTSQTEYEAAVSAHAAAQSRAEAADASLSLARRALRESRLVAPVDGRVSQRLVQPAQVVAAGSPVMEFDSDASVEAVLTVSTSRLIDLAVGQPVEVRYRLTDDTPRLLTGRITHVGRRGLAGGVHEVLIALPDNAAVVPGEPVLARLAVQSVGTEVKLPATAVQTAVGGAASVLVLNEESQTVKRREVRLGSPRGDEITITAGLRSGELVVAVGGVFLRDGQTIRPLLRD